MRAPLLLSLSFLAAAGCTSLLGSFEVSPGGGQDGGNAVDGPSPLPLDASVDAPPDASRDAPTDSRPTCDAPKVVCGGTDCVLLATDEKNCGECGRSCLGGKCVARRCQEFLFSARTDVEQATIVATDTDLFFATSTGDVIQQPVAAGAAPIRLTTAPPPTVYAIAPAPPRVFFTAKTTTGTWDLWSAQVGTASSAQARGESNPGVPVGLVAAGINVHTLEVLPTGLETFQLVTCPQAVAACFANFSGPGRPSKRIVAGNGFVFWTDQFGPVYAMPDAVGLRTTISPSEPTPDSPAWDGATLFWMAGGNGFLRQSPYPTPAATNLSDIQSSANDVLVDAIAVYYSQNDGTGDQLYALAKAAPASPPLKLAGGSIRRIAQTPRAIFWADVKGIHGVRKP